MPAAKTAAAGLIDTLGRRNRRLADRVCLRCDGTFRPPRATARYCSRPCMWANNGGRNKKHQTWWVNPRGYVEGRITLADGSRRRIKQHRYVMEQILGRPLQPWEDVHHRDGVKTNNDPANLEAIDHGRHSTHTGLSRIYQRGCRLVLSDEQRAERARRMSEMRRAAITKAEGK